MSDDILIRVCEERDLLRDRVAKLEGSLQGILFICKTFNSLDEEDLNALIDSIERTLYRHGQDLKPACENCGGRASPDSPCPRCTPWEELDHGKPGHQHKEQP